MKLRRWSYGVGREPAYRGAAVHIPVRWRRLRWALPVALGLLALLLIEVTSRVDAATTSPYPLARSVAYHPLLATLDREADRVATDAEVVALELPFEPGQTVSDVLTLLELEPGQAQQVVEELAKHVNLRRIRPRDRYATFYDPATGLRAFELVLDGRGTAAVRLRQEGWEGGWEPFTRSILVNRLSGRLDDTLEQAIRVAGGEAAVAYLMADVLQWDLDFTRDLRIGDEFDVLYETIYLDGVYHALGEVIALSYENRGQRLEAYRHDVGDRQGYYDAEGRPLRKLFLRSPMKYSRITSRFSRRRFHPVLKRYQPHYGVDYGAPAGTSVRVTANGVVSSAGWDGGGGRTVKVRHPNGYVTSYLHLSRFAESMRAGRRVRQGEVIGYVGSSGLATASHLDYRVQRNGSWINPLSIKSVPADPVPRDDMLEFLAERDRLRRALWEGEPLDRPADGAGGEFSVATATASESGGG